MNENKFPSNRQSNREKDYVTNKLLLVFTIAFALILLLMNVSRMMKRLDTFVTAHTLVKIIAIAALALAVFGVVLAISATVRGIDTRFKLLSGKNIAVASAFVAICAGALALVFDPKVLPVLYVFIPAVAVLYIIFYSYQREFFMIALSSGIGAAGIWLLTTPFAASRLVLICCVIAAVILLLAAFVICAQCRKGAVRLGGRELNVFGSNAQYALIYLTFLLVLLLLAAAVFVPDFAFYFIFGLIGYIVITGVYYTIKLI